MRDKRPVDELSIEELERVLAIRKREARQKQLQRMKRSGRVVGAKETSAPGQLAPSMPPTQPLQQPPGSASVAEPTPEAQKSTPPQITAPGMPTFEDDAAWFGQERSAAAREAGSDEAWKRFVDLMLLTVEIAAVIGLIYLGVTLVGAIGELEDETRAAQDRDNATRMASIPTLVPTPTMRLDQVVLPSGHIYREDGPHEPNLAEIPANLLPAVQAELNRPVIVRPERTLETAYIVYIPKLQLDQTIVQGTDWEALRQGVGQVLNGAKPADPTGNVALAAHNDIYGELFRDLDQLEPGDLITIQTETQTFEYEVYHTEIVGPTDVHVLDSKGRPTVTLISCYPYQVNNQRIVVYANRIDDF